MLEAKQVQQHLPGTMPGFPKTCPIRLNVAMMEAFEHSWLHTHLSSGAQRFHAACTALLQHARDPHIVQMAQVSNMQAEFKSKSRSSIQKEGEGVRQGDNQLPTSPLAASPSLPAPDTFLCRAHATQHHQVEQADDSA